MSKDGWVKDLIYHVLWENGKSEALLFSPFACFGLGHSIRFDTEISLVVKLSVRL